MFAVTSLDYIKMIRTETMAYRSAIIGMPTLSTILVSCYITLHYVTY